MRKILHYVHMSLDGYINGPGGAFDWAELGPELARYSYALEDRTDTLLYGRAVWDMMSSYWPTADQDSDHPHTLAYAPRWREQPKVVVSRTLTGADWNTRIVRVEDVEKLKAESGADILLMGGARMANALTALGLVDEFHVTVHPVVLGGGQPLWPAGRDRLKLDLLEQTPCDGRTVVLRYGRG
jgi:dihydrofolate reductase